MEYTSFRTLEQYEFDKLTFNLFEAKKEIKEKEEKTDKKENKNSKETDKSDKKVQDNIKDEKTKILEQERKDFDIIFKKIQDNFKKFLVSAGDKVNTWVDFVNNNINNEEITHTGQFGYKLFDTDYIVSICKNEKGVCLKLVKKGDDEPVYETNCKECIKEYRDFYNNMLSQIKSFKQKKELEKVQKEKEELDRKRKEKISGFLKA